MSAPARKSPGPRFGLFEVDLQEAELRRSGIRIKLQEQPFQILTMLLERPGQTVTREELRQKLWPADTFVDFEHSLNSSINKLREALGDHSENPRFIETLHRRGYRFIAPVDGAHCAAIEPTESAKTQAPKQLPTAPVPVSSSGLFSATKRPTWPMIVVAAAAITLLVSAGMEIYSFLHRPAPRPFENFTITQVTNSGKVVAGAISPDGKYVASVLDDHGMQSLWLRNLPTGSDTQLIPPAASDYTELRFSPDGNYIYFAMGKNPNWDGYNLFRCPVLGGAPQKVVRYVNSFSFSPDGQSIVFARLNVPEATKFQILTASLEGDNETVWQTGSTSKQPLDEAWSPKGDEIYYSLYSREEGVGAIDVLNLGTRKSHRFATFKEGVPEPGNILWSPDGRSLFALYGGQIGLVDSPRGNIEPITRDPNSYFYLTLSADGKTLDTVLARASYTLSLLSKTGREFAEPGLALPQFDNDVSGLGWSADGNLLVSSHLRLLKLGADGKNQTQLLADPQPIYSSIVSCGTNYLVLNWWHHGGTKFMNLWRTDADGSSAMKLTDGKMDEFPDCSPDGKWVYYLDPISQRIMRVPLEGSGKTEPMFDAPPNDFFAGQLTISADGKTLAAPVQKATAAVNIALFELGSSSSPRILEADIYSSGTCWLRSTHVGKSVAYIKQQNGVGNLWVNRLDGSAAYPITDFKSEQVWAFRFSPDGKKLAIMRGHSESDVVLLHETKR